VDDFLNDPAKRALPSYQPIYFAAWIQDKFVFKDLIMRVGLRLERFDANQPVLKDAYSTVPIYTVGEVKNAADQNIRDLAALIPNNMDNDFAVYVNRDPNQQVSSLSGAKLVGYRDGNRWFDGNGNPITDPQQIARDGKTNRNTPLLIDPNNPNFGKYARDFGMSDFVTDPGYNFRFTEGQKALERNAAARECSWRAAPRHRASCC
jgi:hypothetical protein